MKNKEKNSIISSIKYKRILEYNEKEDKIWENSYIFKSGEYNYKKESVQKLIDKKILFSVPDEQLMLMNEIRPDYIIGGFGFL